MKTEQRFKFINSARPESYVHESRTEHKSLYVVVLVFSSCARHLCILCVDDICIHVPYQMYLCRYLCAYVLVVVYFSFSFSFAFSGLVYLQQTSAFTLPFSCCYRCRCRCRSLIRFIHFGQVQERKKTNDTNIHMSLCLI